MRHRKHLWLVPCLVAGSNLSVRGQDLKSADEVIAKYVEAVGGKDKITAVKSLRLTGKMQVQGMEMPFTIEMKRPSKMRMDSTFQGMTVTNAYDGKTGWQVMPFTGKTDPEKLPDEEVKQMESRADLDGPVGMIVDYEKKGHKVEFEGTDEIEGAAVYKLKVVKKDGSTDLVYIDKEHFLPVGMKSKVTRQGTEMEVESSFGDYKPVAGMMYPHSISQKMPMGSATTVFEKAEPNVDIADDRFIMPEKKAEEAAKDEKKDPEKP